LDAAEDGRGAPAAAMGIGVHRLLDRIARVIHRCASWVAPEGNPAFRVKLSQTSCWRNPDVEEA
jgi:hypothetical protein